MLWVSVSWWISCGACRMCCVYYMLGECLVLPYTLLTSLSLSLTHTHTHTSLSLSHTHTHTHTHFSLFQTHTYPHTISHTQSHTYIHTHTYPQLQDGLNAVVQLPGGYRTTRRDMLKFATLGIGAGSLYVAISRSQVCFMCDMCVCACSFMLCCLCYM